MEPVNQQLQDIFLWLIRTSLHGTILLAIILLVRAVVKGKFRFSMVYWLWMLLLLRLMQLSNHYGTRPECRALCYRSALSFRLQFSFISYKPSSLRSALKMVV